MNNCENRFLGEAEASRKSTGSMCARVSHVGGSDFAHVGFGQCCHAVLLTACMIATALVFSVAVVLQLSSEKEMVWTNAPRTITAMENIHPSWNRADVQSPGNTMAAFHFLRVGSVHRTVTGRINTANPHPASVALLNVHLKPFSEGFSRTLGNDWTMANRCGSVASFGNTVGDVLCDRAEFQVVGSHTPWTIAGVHYHERSRIASVCNHPCYSGRSFASSVKRENSISAIIDRRRPKPAAIGFLIDLGPKAVENVLRGDDAVKIA